MKNEDKIIELLTESLQRQDQLAKLIERQTLVQDSMLQALVGMKSEIKELRNDVQELSSVMRKEIIQRIERLEEAVFKKGA
jgi:hypothetical protein